MTAANRNSNLSEVSRRTWDAVVIGAGPAGAVAAHLLARHGATVLLVDAKAFPREKACGGCLNARALGILDTCGLSTVLRRAAAVPLRTMQLVCRRRAAQWPLEDHVVVNRGRFDAALVASAIESGAEFHPSVTAQVLPKAAGGLRQVQLQRGADRVETKAQVVLCADGLTQSSLRRLPEFNARVAPAARLGLGAVLRDDNPDYPKGQLTMAVARGGYVGATRSAGGTLTLAAAVDATQLKAAASPAALIRDVLQSCDLPAPVAVDDARWHATPPLTRTSQRLSAQRLLVVGDAAGYVEPFTGEGIAWAMFSAALAVPLALDAVHAAGDPQLAQWGRILKRKVMRNQWMCRLLARLLRWPSVAACSLELWQRLPLPLQRQVMSRVGGRRSTPLLPLPPLRL